MIFINTRYFTLTTLYCLIAIGSSGSAYLQACLEKHNLSISGAMPSLSKTITPAVLNDDDGNWICVLRLWVHCTNIYCPIPSSIPEHPSLGYLSQDQLPPLRFVWQTIEIPRSNQQWWELLQEALVPSTNWISSVIPSELCPFYRYMIRLMEL